MSTLIGSTVAAAALASSLGSGAAVPAAAATIAPAAYTQFGPQRPNPPHNYRLKFNNLQRCRARAAHDHPGRSGDWDCRRGPDRNNPWEYWGR